jgi:hypothetical protein
MKLDVQITDKGQMATGPHLHIGLAGASVTIPYDVQTLKGVVEGLHSHIFVAICRRQSAAAQCMASQTWSAGTAFFRRRRRMTIP